MTQKPISIKFVALLFIFLVPTLLFAQKNKDKWKTELNIDHGSVLLTTYLEVVKDKEQTTLTSPRNADARLVGGFKARMGRLFGKSPKKGILLTIKGIQKGDSLTGTAQAPVLGNLKFQGVLTKDILSGNLLMNDTLVIGTLSGRQSNEKRSDFKAMYPRIIDTIQRNIYSKDVLQTKEWLKFSGQLKKLCDKAYDDLELYIGFSMLSANLPFSHLYLMMQENEVDDDEPIVEEPTVFFEEKNSNTAYLRVTNFSSSKKELSEIFPQIVNNKSYQNLIIDLRNNGGGGIEAANEFGRHIISGPMDIGYFATNKLDYSGFNAAQFGLLPEAKPQTTEEFIANLKAGKGAKLVFSQSNLPAFSGKIYVLTNGRTGSTCEPIVYLLKEKKLATIVGENTAGAMLSGTIFDLEGKYKLFLPIADFYTYDGVRLDQLGVKPDIETSSAEALDKALEIIKKNNER